MIWFINLKKNIYIYTVYIINYEITNMQQKQKRINSEIILLEISVIIIEYFRAGLNKPVLIIIYSFLFLFN